MADPVEQMPNLQPPINWCPAPPKIISADVFPYEANEVAISHSEAGHLAPDVVLTGAAASSALCQFLLIRHFGVNWRHLKDLTLRDALLRGAAPAFRNRHDAAIHDPRIQRLRWLRAQ